MAKTPSYTKRAIDNYRKKFDFIQIKLDKGMKELIESKTGEKASAYISKIVNEQLKADGII